MLQCLTHICNNFYLDACLDIICIVLGETLLPPITLLCKCFSLFNVIDIKDYGILLTKYCINKNNLWLTWRSSNVFMKKLKLIISSKLN